MHVTLGHKTRYPFSETLNLEHSEVLLSLFGGMPRNNVARVGIISNDLICKIGAHIDLVVVTLITMMKIKGKHPEILYEDFELLQSGFATARVYQDRARHLCFIFRDPRQKSRTLKAVVKATRDGSELILASYRLCTGKNLRAELKKRPILRHGEW